MKESGSAAVWSNTQRVAVYAGWYYTKQRPHHLVDVLCRHGCRVQVHASRGLRERGLPLPAGARVVSRLRLPVRLESNRWIGSFVGKFNQRCRTRVMQGFIADQADLHIYAHIPVELPSSKPATLVYDCMDEWAGFDNVLPDIAAREEQLCQQADRIWVVSRFLQERLSRHGDKVHYVPNGVDNDHYSMVPQLRCQAIHTRPTLGYVGALAHWFDAALVGEVARILSDWDILLIGPQDLLPQQRALMTAPNIRFLGRRPYESLPALMAGIDVCTIPFVLSDLIRGTSPIKLYEYLAAGCPVVSTPMPEVVAMAEPGVVACADSPGDFASAVRQMLSDDRTARRQELGRQHSWDSRFAKALAGLNVR